LCKIFNSWANKVLRFSWSCRVVPSLFNRAVGFSFDSLSPVLFYCRSAGGIAPMVRGMFLQSNFMLSPECQTNESEHCSGNKKTVVANSQFLCIFCIRIPYVLGCMLYEGLVLHVNALRCLLMPPHICRFCWVFSSVCTPHQASDVDASPLQSAYWGEVTFEVCNPCPHDGLRALGMLCQSYLYLTLCRSLTVHSQNA
jgi:hypothetical protein